MRKDPNLESGDESLFDAICGAKRALVSFNYAVVLLVLHYFIYDALKLGLPEMR